MALFRLLDVEKLSDATKVCVRAGELHVHQIDSIREQLYDILEQEMPGKLILDLKEVQFGYSDLLELLLRLHKRMQMANGKFVVSNVSQNIRDLITATKLDQVIQLDEG